jgi:S-adenosylmethionine decarboxylase
MKEKIKLHGFNNLTKTLSFNMYDICYTKSVEDRMAYIEYIDGQYNVTSLTQRLREVTEIIGAKILNIAVQDYEPQGASVTMLICDEGGGGFSVPENTGASAAAHLDKSHITVHTYPEYHPSGGVCTFRVDIDVSTCGEITPLKTLNFLINSFDADIMTIDYRVRGFTRNIIGDKLFIDHPLTSIQSYIDAAVKKKYHFIDVNVYQENIFHTKCKLREFDLDNYFFHFSEEDISAKEVRQITAKLRREMDEIFYGRNFEGD